LDDDQTIAKSQKTCKHVTAPTSKQTVSYPQLACNERRLETVVKAIRKDQVDKEELKRLVHSISRVLPPEGEIVTEMGVALGAISIEPDRFGWASCSQYVAIVPTLPALVLSCQHLDRPWSWLVWLWVLGSGAGALGGGQGSAFHGRFSGGRGLCSSILSFVMFGLGVLSVYMNF